MFPVIGCPEIGSALYVTTASRSNTMTKIVHQWRDSIKRVLVYNFYRIIGARFVQKFFSEKILDFLNADKW